jgi:hypothetical protein
MRALPEGTVKPLTIKQHADDDKQAEGMLDRTSSPNPAFISAPFEAV